MKYFAFILSLYTFYLVSVPCVDEAMHTGYHESQQNTGQIPGNSCGHADACSPFCICSCCSVPVTLTPVTLVNQPFFSFSQSIFSGSVSIISSFSFTFWQPPKLS